MQFTLISHLVPQQAMERIRALDFYKDDPHVTPETSEDILFMLGHLKADGIIAHDGRDVGYVLYYPVINEYNTPLSPHFQECHNRSDWKVVCEYLTTELGYSVGTKDILHLYDYAIHPDFRGKNFGEILLKEAFMQTQQIVVGFVDVQRMHSAKIAQRIGWNIGLRLEKSPDGDHPSQLIWYLNKPSSL
jgi:ribosomal protein S18 acetylase RimI-like enzyme